MSQKYLIRIAELERLLSEQAEALRQKDQQLSLVEETEAFLRSALTRAEEKIEEDEREIEHLRAQIEKLRRMLFGIPPRLFNIHKLKQLRGRRPLIFNYPSSFDT